MDKLEGRFPVVLVDVGVGGVFLAGEAGVIALDEVGEGIGEGIGEREKGAGGKKGQGWIHACGLWWLKDY